MAETLKLGTSYGESSAYMIKVKTYWGDGTIHGAMKFLVEDIARNSVNEDNIIHVYFENDDQGWTLNVLEAV